MNEAIEGDLNNYSKIAPEQTANTETFKFVQFLTYSGFNPPHPNRKLRGDFFYLQLRTLEGFEHCITSCQTGYYFNNSTTRVYDPTPQNDFVFSNLLDLICYISPSCKQSLEKLINTEIKEENIYSNPLNLYAFEVKWLTDAKIKSLKNYEPDPTRTENFLLDLHGFDPSGIRDWNEELQVCRDFPKNNMILKLNRDKALLKVHSDFVEAATRVIIYLIKQY